jgi:hypothetical protein
MDEFSLGNFVHLVSAPLPYVLRALYQAIRDDAGIDRWAIINSGCAEEEIAAVEESLNIQLSPLHRFVLGLSNGGTIPCLTSLSLLYAAVPREAEWRIVGPYWSPADKPDTTLITARQTGPILPQIIGQPPLPEIKAAADATIATDGPFVGFASGFGGQEWGYAVAKNGRIDCIVPEIGRYVDASEFDVFLTQMPMSERCAESTFVELITSYLVG